MALTSVPDLFDDATHDELDKAVNDATKDWHDVPQHTLQTLIGPFLQTLLNQIVNHSKGKLDPKYLIMQENEKLIEAHDELQEMLLSAWDKKSYREIRNLDILGNPSAVQLALLPVYRERELFYMGLSTSFQIKYSGAAIHGFHEYLTENESLFKVKKYPGYYAKFCSIVQSSGTGKSRLLTEYYRMGVVVIYMNLRKEDDVRSFPARDEILANIITKFPPTEAEYQLVCYAFFTALFEALIEKLSESGSEEGVMTWAKAMCNVGYKSVSTTRKDFFENLLKKYNKIHAQIALPSSKDSHVETNPSSSDVDKAAEAVEELSLSDDHSPGTQAETHSGEDALLLLTRVYRKLGNKLKEIFTSKGPRVVIAIDEAHPLTPTKANDVGGYRPADVLCRIINKYSENANHPIWVVFASTTSKVADFSPPNEKYNSDSAAVSGQQLFPPYTQLGWDQRAKALRGIKAKEVSKFRNIASYGRPLWLSLLTAHQLPSAVLSTASSKLCGGERFDPNKIDHVLAVFGQRFVVNITFGHPDSVAFLETAVASHLRICIGTTLDRRWRWTSYPSEPLLSCAAADTLHEDPDNMQLALGVLLNAINRGMIDIGQRGELASRLIWLLAKDLYVREITPDYQNKKPQKPEEDILDCQMIPVVDWLQFVFGSKVWGDAKAREKFENAYINFSHWVNMTANFASKDANKIALDELTLRHWQRTSAVQCCHSQPLIDKVIPIYFKESRAGSKAKSRMSQIFISDKVGMSRSSNRLLKYITRRSEHLAGRTKQNGNLKSLPARRDKSKEEHHVPDPPLPYIAILADLGRTRPPFSSSFPMWDSSSDPCLRIYAPGIDTDTYPFLNKHQELLKHLQTLVQLQQIPETKKPFTEYLNAQVKFGNTATEEHMHWEHGKEVPELRDDAAEQSDEDEEPSESGESVEDSYEDD